MLNRIIHFSLYNRLAILVTALLIAIAGIYTAMTMEVDVFPDLNAPTVVVMTEANGMAPEEVERIVTFPIETAVNGSTGVRRVRSTSTTGFSCVWVEFDWGTEIYRARQIVTEKLAEVSASLPENVGQPTLGPQSSILGEVMIIGLTADSTSQRDLRTYADWTIRPRLLSIGGVAQVSVQGGEEKEYQVLLHPERMKHHSVEVSEAVEAVRDMNQNVSGGVLYEYGNEYLIRGALTTSNCEELGQTVVKTVDGVPVLLEQIADIKVGDKTPKTGTASNNAKKAVLLTVAKQPNVSTKKLTNDLDEALGELQKRLPQDVKVDSEIFRQSRFIDASISNIQESLIEGALFVVVILFIFLMNARTTIISLLTIPLSLLVSILTLKCFGLTINTMSIGGMAIAIGSLVDDAIVDVENVYRRLKVPLQLPRGGEGALDIIFSASKEVRLPILNSTLIIVVSFLPLFFLNDMEGRMLVPLGVAFIVSLFASTVVALTLTPVLCSYMLTGKSLKDTKEPKFVIKLKAWYADALMWAFDRKKTVLASTFGVFIITLIIFFSLGRSFLPSFNEGSFTISISTLPGISLEESDKIGMQAERMLMDIPEIQTVARKTGRAELDEHAFGVNTSEIEAPFVLNGRSREELQHEVREKLSTLPGVAIEIGQPISHRIDAMLSGTRANIAIKLFGTDLNKMYRIGNDIKHEISEVEGVADLNVEQQVERPQLRITPRRSLMAKYGVTPKQFADYVSVLLEGEEVSQVYEGNAAFALTVKVDDEDRNGIEEIRNLMIDANGKKIPLEYIAKIESTSGPNTINRENAQRKIVISANVEGRDLSSTVKDIQQKIDEEIKLPEGYHMEYGGQFESEAKASRTLMLLSLVALLIIYLLIYNQFKNARQAAIVMINLPLALIGGVIAVALTDGMLSIPAIIGFISLFGIATRNGILLVDRYNQLAKNENENENENDNDNLNLNEIETANETGLRSIIIRGSQDRLNPILMTALTSALALVPLALGGDLPGNEIQSPMAKVILGGLVSSTLLNLFVIPLIFNRKPLSSKRSMAEGNVKGWIFGLLLLLPSNTFAEDLSPIINRIMESNMTLKKYRAQTDATKAGNHTGMTLADPEVEFNYLWGSPKDVGQRKDISVTQHFDYATVFGLKRKEARSKDELAEIQYEQAKMLCQQEAITSLANIAAANEILQEHRSRITTAEQIADMLRKKMNAGEANKIDMNKAILDLATHKTDAAEAEMERDGMMASVIFTVLDDETRNRLLSITMDDVKEYLTKMNAPTLMQLEQEKAMKEENVAEAELRSARSASLPELTAGYMSELTREEKFRGITIGLSIPLWSNRGNVTRAKSQIAAVKAEREETIANLTAQRNALENNVRQLAEMTETLEVSLKASSSETLLRKALYEGEISMLEYIADREAYYDLRLRLIEKRCEQLIKIAELRMLSPAI